MSFGKQEGAGSPCIGGVDGRSDTGWRRLAMGIMSGHLPLEGGGLTATRNSGGMVSLGKAREREGTHRFVL